MRPMIIYDTITSEFILSGKFLVAEAFIMTIILSEGIVEFNNFKERLKKFRFFTMQGDDEMN